MRQGNDRGSGLTLGLRTLLFALIAVGFRPGKSELEESAALGPRLPRQVDHYNRHANEKGIPPNIVYRFILQTLGKGCTVSLKCIATGSPTPTISWKIDGFELPNSERIMIDQYVALNGDVISHLNVTQCVSEDSGEISCSAKNSVGVMEHKARLNIFGPPRIREMRPQTAVTGKDFSIKCPVSGYPIQEITWKKDGKFLPLTRLQSVSTDGVLTIKNVQKSDSGNYICTAKFKELSDSRNVEINVVVPPKVTSFSPLTIVEEGQRILKYCEATGDAPMELNWLRNAVALRGEDEEGISTQHIRDIAVVLIITKVRRELHNSTLTCVARNAAGEDTLTTTLTVQVSPTISKFRFPDVFEGERVQVNCLVNNQGVESITFKWFKDEFELLDPAELSLRILQVDKFSSMLIIDSANQAMSGNYTCLVGNRYGNSSHTANLIVYVPPKWIQEPRDTEAVEGEPLVLHCAADGFPAVKIAWKKSDLTRREMEIPVQSFSHHSPLPNVVSFPNGTLLISKLSAHDGKTPTFICEGVNGIGSGISKLVHIKVNAPAKIHGTRNATVRAGSTAVLVCQLSGDFPISVRWHRGPHEINPLLDTRYVVKTVNTSVGISSELSLSNVRKEDGSQPYTCSATNLCNSSSVGIMGSCRRDERSSWLFILEPPETPTNLHVISQGSRFIELGWLLTQSSGEGTRMIVKYRTERGSWNSLAVSNTYKVGFLRTDSIFSETINNLRPATKYYFYITSENAIGSSESEKLEASTNGEAPEMPPKNIIVTPVLSTQLKVQWDHISWSNGEVLGYNIGYKKFNGEGEPYAFITVENPAYETILLGLTPFTKYEIVVQSFNEFGSGPLSDKYYGTTLEDIPLGSPEGVSCYTLTSQKLQINWNQISHQMARGVVQGYIVYLQRSDLDYAVADDTITLNTTDTSVLIDNLAKYTIYEVQVLAYTRIGSGDLSKPIYCQTEEDIPGAPEQVKAVRTVSSVVVCWTSPPLWEQNGQLLKYSVMMGSRMEELRTVTVPPNITRIEVKDLTPPFTVHISASTKMGEGVNTSITLQPTNQSQLGGGLLSFGQHVYAVAKSDVRLACETGAGSPVRTWFHFSKILKETDRHRIEADGSWLEIKGLSRADGGNYSCNQPTYLWDGITYRSERIFYFLVVQEPPQPPLLDGSAASSSSISIRWTVVDSGRAPLKGFLLHMRVLDEWLERRLQRQLNQHLIQNLRCGTAYQMYLTAYNRAGMSKPSQTLNISTLGSKPFLAFPPQSLLQVNSSWIRVRLGDAWNEGNCPIHNFRVLYRESSQYHWKTVDESLNREKRSVYLLGLREETTYIIKISATNDAGTTEVTTTADTLGSLRLNAEPSNAVDKPLSPPFYLNLRLMGPVLLSALVAVFFMGGLCFLLTRKLRAGRSNELSAPGESFTYFKQNCQNSQQVYMTVKKATPLKNPDSSNFDLIPQSGDDVYPYATFELKDRARKESFYSPSSVALQHASNSNAFYICTQRERNICNSKLGKSHNADESEEEYESIGSDSDAQTPSLPKLRSGGFHEEKATTREFQNAGRYANRYECVQPNNHNRITQPPASFALENAGKIKTRMQAAEGSRGFHPRKDFQSHVFEVPRSSTAVGEEQAERVSHSEYSIKV